SQDRNDLPSLRHIQRRVMGLQRGLHLHRWDAPLGADALASRTGRRRMTYATRIPLPHDPSEALLSDGCAWCCDPLAVGEYGGDVLCGRCADEWTAEQEALDEIERVAEWASTKHAGLYRGLE